MNSKKAITLFVLLSATVILMSAAFSYAVDPLCYYRCGKVDAGRKNLNGYYRNLQRVLLYPDSELLVLGSSRGESLPLAWLSEEYSMKALNLSVGGADIHAKETFLRFALDHLRLKKVIWIADYFELIDESMSDKITLTPALHSLAAKSETSALTPLLKRLPTLIEHNTIEAAFALLRGKRMKWPPDRGENSDLDLQQCRKTIAEARFSDARLSKEVGLIYDGYAGRILVPQQNSQSYEKLRRLAGDLADRQIDLLLLVPAYHPEFLRRLAAEHPTIMARHKVWVDQLKALASPHTSVRDFFIDNRFTQEPTRYWTDGVHFNCAAAADMLRRK